MNLKHILNGIIFPVIILMVFLDGMLVADHWSRNNISLANDQQVMESVFNLEEDSASENSQPTFTVIEEIKKSTIYPFTSQAPLGDWNKPWSDFSEEATIYMAYKWAMQEEIGNRNEIADDLSQLGIWEEKWFGSSGDTTISQSLEMLNDYFGYYNAHIEYDLSLENLKWLIGLGNTLIIPVNGKILDNPHYGNPAPIHNQVFLIDFDDEAGEFIVNDPATRYGEASRYDYEKLLNSISDIDGSKVALSIEPVT